MKARIMLITLIAAVAVFAACALFAVADDAAEPRRANRLAKSTSPYLLQHAHNPVDWYEWSDEAFDAAKKQDKPIFLSVGYSTCHWCHVMAHECFEDAEVAKLLNARFICIKVDREQLPDVDEQYMLATQLFTQRGGWPNSVFLTPDRRPWFAGTYFPKPQFMQLLNRLGDAWTQQRDAVEKQADQFAAAIRQAGASGLGERAPLDPSIVKRAAAQFLAHFDERNGGFGGAPKFPPHGALRVLFANQQANRDLNELSAIARTLDAMRSGGLYDHVGGGFHRYATDARWFLPHFEKMLYDNAQLIVNYTDGWLYTQDDAYARVIDETYRWLEREMLDPAGGFYSALDADSEGEEGKCYLWSYAELIAVLGETDGPLFADIYGATKDGTYYEEATRHRPGTNVLYLPKPIDEVAKAKSLDAGELHKRLAAMRAKLLAVRVKRVPPHLDDKVLASWNGLMIEALAYAGRMIEDDRYTKAAARAAEFVLVNMRDADGRLVRAWRKGQTTGHGYLDDYAYLIRGLLELHEATHDAKWLDAAKRLADLMIADFYDDQAGGFFVTSKRHDGLILRSKGLNAGGNQPMANGVAAECLVRLATATKDPKYLKPAVATFSAFSGMMTRQPHGCESLVAALPLLLAAAEQDSKLLAAALGRDPEADAFAAGGVVTVNAFAESLTAKPGDTVRVALRITIAADHHIYAPADGVKDVMPTTLRLADGAAGFTLGEVKWPTARAVHDAVIDKDIAIYEGDVVVIATVTIAADAKPGEAALSLTIRAQACDDKVCLVPADYTVAIPITIDPAATPSKPRHPAIFGNP